MAGVSGKLTASIRSALAHLDDPAYLESHALADQLLVDAVPGESRGQALRRRLQLAIEALDPGPQANSSDSRALCYQILSRYAIAKESIVAIALRFDVSERQAYRLLQRGIVAIGNMLTEGISGQRQALTVDSPALPASQLGEEVARLLHVGTEKIDMDGLVSEVVTMLGPLAAQRGVVANFQPSRSGAATMICSRVMMRQAIVNLCSHAVSSTSGCVNISVAGTAESSSVEVSYQSRLSTSKTGLGTPYSVARQLISQLGLEWQRRDDPDGLTTITFGVLHPRDRTVLVVDDNEGMIALYRSYLRHKPYIVHGAASGREALSLVTHLAPDIIVLDIMLPDIDGWEVLQSLRATEEGQRAHIVVCSVINDPVLSAALGVNGFLHKPVERETLLDLFDRIYATEV